ncbi:MAG: beta-lactamase family protein [Deltaproteobacteria bacterium]|nr:beta-lactamase family protein [Deltaproteobacteria bacterium]
MLRFGARTLILAILAAPCCISVFFTRLLYACDDPSPPSQSEDDSDKIRLEKKLSDYIAQQMKQTGVVGLSITLVSGEDVVYSRGFGYQDREQRIPATDQSVYRMGSLSKVLTAMAVMQLVEKGVLQLDAPVTRYLPEFHMLSRTPGNNAITIRHLLTHHAGLPTDLMKGADALHPDTLETFVARLRNEYVVFKPGEAFLYSNVGYALLGRVIEVVTGETFETYMQQHVFTPMDMNHSGFGDANIAKHLRAQGYINGRPGTPYPVREVSAGALAASTLDMANVIKCVFNNGAPLLHGHSMTEMLTRQNTDTPLDLDIAMGLGWQLTNQLGRDKNAGSTAFHDGLIWHFSSYMLLLPEHKLGVIVAANSDNSPKAVRDIGKKSMQYLLWQRVGVARQVAPSTGNQGASISATPSRISVFAGSYDTANGLFELSAKDGYLEGIRNGIPVVMVPLGDGRFEMRRKLNAVVSWKSPDLDGVYFKFVEVGDQMILATLDEDVRIPFGHRVSPAPIPLTWKNSVGTWNVTAHDGDYAYIHSIKIEKQHQFLIAKVTVDSMDNKQTTLQLVLKPENSQRAIVMGIGRYRGDTLRLEPGGHHKRQLRFQGYELVRVNDF